MCVRDRQLQRPEEDLENNYSGVFFFLRPRTFVMLFSKFADFVSLHLIDWVTFFVVLGV